MGRPRLTDAQIAALPPEKRAETLRKRRKREEAKNPIKSAVLAFPSKTAAAFIDAKINGVPECEERAREMYERLRNKMVRQGTWKDEASHGLLMIYCKSIVAVEISDPDSIPPGAVTAATKIYNQLNLADLPADRAARESKFSKGW